MILLKMRFFFFFFFLLFFFFVCLFSLCWNSDSKIVLSHAHRWVISDVIL